MAACAMRTDRLGNFAKASVITADKRQAINRRRLLVSLRASATAKSSARRAEAASTSEVISDTSASNRVTGENWRPSLPA